MEEKEAMGKKGCKRYRREARKKLTREAKIAKKQTLEYKSKICMRVYANP